MQRWHLTLVLAVLAAGGVAVAGVVPTMDVIPWALLRPRPLAEVMFAPLPPDDTIPTFQTVLDGPAEAEAPIPAPIAAPPPPPPLQRLPSHPRSRVGRCTPGHRPMPGPPRSPSSTLRLHR